MSRKVPVMVQVGLLAGPFMTMVDSSVVNVALPQLARAFGSPLQTVQWVASAYLLAMVVALTANAYLAKRFGSERTYLASLVGFTVGSALAAAAPSLAALVAARILQGVFGAQLVPLAMNMLMGDGGTGDAISPAAGVILFLAPAVGPTVGGLILHAWAWPSIFLVNVPIGALAVLGAMRLAGRPPVGGAARVPSFDTVGFFTLAMGIGLSVLGATRATSSGWLAPSVWPAWAVGAALLVGYGAWARRREHPIVSLALVRGGAAGLRVLLLALVSVVTSAVIFLVPAFLETAGRHSALTAGLAMVPQAVLMGMGMLLGTKLPGRVGQRATVVSGVAVLLLANAALLGLGAASPVWLFAVLLAGRGLAVGLVIQPVLSALLAPIRRDRLPDATTLFNVVEQVAGTFGVSLMVTLFAVQEAARVQAALRFHGPAAVPAAEAAGLHDVVWVLVAVAGACLAVALLPRDAGAPAREEAARDSVL